MVDVQQLVKMVLELNHVPSDCSSMVTLLKPVNGLALPVADLEQVLAFAID